MSLLEKKSFNQIELAKDPVTSETQMAQLLYNVSRLYHSWAKDENVSKESLSKYWHGETEEYIRHKRKEVTNAWIAGLEKSRKMLLSSKVKMTYENVVHVIKVEAGFKI